MNKHIVLAMAGFILAVQLCGCGSKNETANIKTYTNVSSSSVLSAEKLEDLGVSTENEDKTPETSGSPTKNKTSDYAYKAYVLEKAGKSNAVFCGEAFLTQLDIMNSLSGEKTETKDYLSMESNDVMKRLNRIWVDDNVSFAETDKLKGLFYKIDLQSPSALNERNEWLKTGTDGYMTSMPILFNQDAQMDITSVLCFSDKWQGGNKPLDTVKKTFTNADGIQTEITMLRDEGTEYYELSNAKAYKMPFENGNYMTVILPDAGIDMTDINISPLIEDTIEPKQAHVNFYMPELDLESAYSLDLKDFGIQNKKLIADSVSEESSTTSVGTTPCFTHVAKLNIGQYGANTDAAENYIDIPESYGENDNLNIIKLICDKPFMFYIYDAENSEVAYFGVINKMGDTTTATPEPTETVPETDT